MRNIEHVCPGTIRAIATEREARTLRSFWHQGVGYRIAGLLPWPGGVKIIAHEMEPR